MDIDRRVKRFGYDDLIISLELSVPGDLIGGPEDWVKCSLQHIQQIAPDMILGSTSNGLINTDATGMDDSGFVINSA